MCAGLLFTLEYEDELGDIHWLKVHKVTVEFLRATAVPAGNAESAC